MGRFVSADTIVPSPGNPQSFNRYSHVLNNPLKYNDPSGHREVDCGLAEDCSGGDGRTVLISNEQGAFGTHRRVYTFDTDRTLTWNNIKNGFRLFWDASLFGQINTDANNGVASWQAWGDRIMQRMPQSIQMADQILDDPAMQIVLMGMVQGPPGLLKFGQASVGRRFTSPLKSGFKYAGWEIQDVAAGLRSGQIHPNELPIQFIERDGTRYAINNRSLKALRMAGKEPVSLIDITGDPYYERVLTERLREAEMLGIDLNNVPIRGIGR